ncbi:class F sortase [Blastococcus litoris]|uniref:class F sortase n=1 Tax=Blastococcus litoris TaxID=2171622 RepID=UPI000E30A0FA|nr:class F sortase [Blastococcus litoris]
MVGLLCASLGMPAAGAEDGGQLRFAHLSPDTPAVDVAVAPLPSDRTGPLTDPGEDATTGLAYGAVSEALDLPAGSYAVSVRAEGAARSVPPALSARVDVPAGGALTVTLTGSFADLGVATLTDDLSAPPPGSARVRVLAAAGSLPAADVALSGGPALASGLPFGAAAEPRTVPAGPATLLVGDAEPVPVTFAAGSVVTLLVLDGEGGGLLVRPVVDAAGPSVVPTGAVEAGTGDLPGGPAPVALAALAALAGLVLAGRRGRVLLVATGLAAVTGVTAPAGAAEAVAPVVAVSAAGSPAAPVRLSVPDAGVDALLAGAGLDSAGALVPPADPALAGWYTGGPVPGLPGPAVIAGHVDWAGAPAVFSRLGELRPGAEVVVGRADGSTARFTVTRVVSRPKTDFPVDDVYAPTSGAELRLITCGGSFDRAAGSYRDNVVVFAEAVG